MGIFTLQNDSGLQIYNISQFCSGNVRALISTRKGGVSKGDYCSLNAGLKSGDDVQNVIENIKILCDAAGIDINDLVFSDQVHGNTVMTAEKKDRGKGIITKSDISGVDSLITNDKNTALCIFTADCIPLFLYDRYHEAVGLCHAGWRGIINDIAVKTIASMGSRFNSEPEMISAVIGPSIRSCCFEVSNDVKNIFIEKFNGADGIVIEKEGRAFIDLQKALQVQMISMGIDEDNIFDSGICTCCSNDVFYSYRGDGSKTGRMISIIELK